MDWQYKRVLVLGLGKSGLAAARVVSGLGATTIASDEKKLAQLDIAALDGFAVQVLAGGFPELKPLRLDLVIASPGVPIWAAPLAEARALGIPVWGELELAFRLLPADVKIVAITGSNGKTTTTALVGQILADAGWRVTVAGNIGTPLVSKVAAIEPGDAVVLEASSFQLETTLSFRPHVAAVLNTTPDHLDWHQSFAAYREAKAKIFARQAGDDAAIFNFDDPEARGLAGSAPARSFLFSRQTELPAGAYVRDGELVVDAGGGPQAVCPVAALSLPGSHNLENCLAAAMMASVLGIAAASLAKTLTTFPGVVHRLEPVAAIGGVRYVNDSKGTNPEATIKALEAYDAPIILLAGGYDKGSDFAGLAQAMRGRVRHLILMGATADKIAAAAQAAGAPAIHRAGDFAAAVRQAHRLARPGDVVLLSPACASWGMFRNYEERGEIFKQLVRELGQGGGGER